MERNETAQATKRRLALERLIESIENGDVDAIEDLSREEIDMLLARVRPNESLEQLFDRMRQPSRERE